MRSIVRHIDRVIIDRDMQYNSGYMAFKFIKMDIDRFRKDIDRFLNALEYRDMVIKKLR